MSASFPYPLSDHRSYSGQDSASFDTDPLVTYSHEHYLSRPDYETEDDAATGPFSTDVGMYRPPAQPSFRLHPNPAFHLSTPPYPQSPHSALSRGSTHSSANTSTLSLSFARDAYSSERIATTSSVSHSHSSADDSTTQSDTERASFRATPSTKPRKDKNRVELAPDQPLTTQGKPRTRVYVACVQCRSRKIRCDGAKPVCHNCSRRPESGGPCSYDSVPKRRGPDKMPGARQRSTAGADGNGQPRRRTRRRIDTADESRSSSLTRLRRIDADATFPLSEVTLFSVGPATTSKDPRRDVSESRKRARVPSPLSSPLHSSDTSFDTPGHHAVSLDPPDHLAGGDVLMSQEPVRYDAYDTLMYDQFGVAPYAPPYAQNASLPYPSVSDARDEHHGRAQAAATIAPEPSVVFARDMWWDSLMSLYSSTLSGPSARPTAVPPGLREITAQRITADLRFLFRCSTHWVSFINIPRFFSRLHDVESRRNIQPSLILAALALATFLRSSELEQGVRGRDRALRLRDEAQGALEASLNARWIDESLVQASWLLAFFEASAHPLHSAERVCSALAVLDSLIRSLALTKLDAADARASTFAPGAVPTVALPPQPPPGHPNPAAPPKCVCAAYSLGEASPRSIELTPLWSATPVWASDWTDGEVAKEECRRLVWSTVMLVAGAGLYASAVGTRALPDLSVMDAANYALLFPGESVISRGDERGSAKHSVWALYMRTLLLWNACVRMARAASMSYFDRAQFAVQAWLEIDTIESALSRHTCNIERTFIFATREYLFNIRMCIFNEIKEYVPQAKANANIVHRRKAEEWMIHQASLANSAMLGLHNVTGQPTSELSGCPFYIFWFMAQISRVLTVWGEDNTLVVALDSAKALLLLLERLTSLWPCPEPQRKTREFRSRLTSICHSLGIAPPLD